MITHRSDAVSRQRRAASKSLSLALAALLSVPSVAFAEELAGVDRAFAADVVAGPLRVGGTYSGGTFSSTRRITVP